MQRLIDLPLDDPEPIAAARAALAAAPGDDEAAVALGLVLAGAGCTYEAAHLLRPRRKMWKDADGAEAAKAALDAQAWWNKNWREFAQLSQAGRKDDALALLGGRAADYWDLPPLLMHLGGFAAKAGDPDLAEHIFRRIAGLADRGLPKMEMAAFAYASRASLIDLLAERGDTAAALAAYAGIRPNPGNAMAHELQGARLLVLAGREDDALSAVAGIVVVAEKERKGYSRDMRLAFVDRDPVLDDLRTRPEWQALRSDPVAFLKR